MSEQKKIDDGELTIDEAEAIVMAVEVGLFHGRPSEVAMALLRIKQRDNAYERAEAEKI